MSHPYEDYEGTALWTALDHALKDLERNNDVTITTSKSIVIGYLCKQLMPVSVEKHRAEGGNEV